MGEGGAGIGDCPGVNVFLRAGQIQAAVGSSCNILVKELRQIRKFVADMQTKCPSAVVFRKLQFEIGKFAQLDEVRRHTDFVQLRGHVNRLGYLGCQLQTYTESQ